MIHSRLRKFLISLLLLSLLAVPVGAQTPTPTMPETTQQKPLIGLVAAALKLTPAQVQDYKSQAGMGGLVKAYYLAQASGQTIDALIARHAAGEGWGEIAKSLGLHPGNKGRNLGQLIKQQRALERTPPAVDQEPKTPPGQAKQKDTPKPPKSKQKDKPKPPKPPKGNQKPKK